MNARRPRVFKVFLEPICPFSVRAFGKLEDLLDKAGEDRITVNATAIWLRVRQYPGDSG